MKAPEPVKNQADANNKQQLLKFSPWLAEVNKDITYSDFMAYAGNKRKEGLKFDTGEKWTIFKKYYNRK